ncbi:hypothetical protein GF345_01225 [Candidatus Woesearchaeota archaeon]|nr:hypothetical protein [Candidatus Woesearchaeota archaeon]
MCGGYGSTGRTTIRTSSASEDYYPMSAKKAEGLVKLMQQNAPALTGGDLDLEIAKDENQSEEFGVPIYQGIARYNHDSGSSKLLFEIAFCRSEVQFRSGRNKKSLKFLNNAGQLTEYEVLDDLFETSKGTVAIYKKRSKSSKSSGTFGTYLEPSSGGWCR